MDNTLNHKCIYQFFIIKLRISEKNGGSKVVHLIVFSNVRCQREEQLKNELDKKFKIKNLGEEK